MAEFPKPVVAAVNGPAVGLGASIAISSDLVLIAESAWLSDTLQVKLDRLELQPDNYEMDPDSGYRFYQGLALVRMLTL